MCVYIYIYIYIVGLQARRALEPGVQVRQLALEPLAVLRRICL